MIGSPAKFVVIPFGGFWEQKPVAIIKFTCASVIKGIRLRKYDFYMFQDLFVATFRYKDPLMLSSNVKVVLKPFIVRKHANLKSKIPALVAPYKCAEFATFALLETRGELFFANSRLPLPKKSIQLGMYLIFLNFPN